MNRLLMPLRMIVVANAGLRAGGNMLIHFGVNRITARYHAPAYVHWLQDEVATIGPYMGRAGLLTAATGVVALAAGRTGRTAAARLTLLGLAGSIADMLITLRGNVPINKQFLDATPESPPPDWMTLRTRWQALHAWRTCASLFAFIAYVLAGFAQARTDQERIRIVSLPGDAAPRQRYAVGSLVSEPTRR